MTRAAVLAALAMLSACSREPAPPATDNGAADYASRVGAGTATGTAAPQGSAWIAAGASAAKVGLAQNTGPYALQTLGDVASTNLGPSAGACTLVSGGQQLVLAIVPIDRTLPGKAVVKIGGQAVRLDGEPGGVNLSREPSRFEGEGFRVEIQPDGRGGAKATTFDIEGESRVLDGEWKCV